MSEAPQLRCSSLSARVRELRPLHADVGAALVDPRGAARSPAFSSTLRSVAQKGDASSTCTARSSKKVAGAAEGAVDDLVREDEATSAAISSRRLPTAPRGEDVGHAERLQGVDVRAVRDLRRVEHVPLAVPGEERDLRCPPTSVSVMGPEGGPKGVSTSRDLALRRGLPAPRRARYRRSPRRCTRAISTSLRSRTEARSLPRPARCGVPAEAERQKGKARRRLCAGASKKMRQRPTLPHGFPCSTIGSGGLNFRVRDGNGCDPTDIATAKSGKERRREAFSRPNTKGIWSIAQRGSGGSRSD